MSAVTIDTAPRSRWTKPRLAKAAFMGGAGFDVREIAVDVESTPSAVRQVLRSMGIALSDVRRGNLTIDVGARLAAFGDFAKKRGRGETPEALVTKVVRILADDPTLLANVLDDEG